jgi:outer membrane immunogenic protein
MVKFYKVFFSLLLVAAFSVASQTASAQTVGFAPGKGYKQVNFGLELEGWGFPIYAGMDFGVGEFITVGPRIVVGTEGSSYEMPIINSNNELDEAKVKSRTTVAVPSFRGDYHFSGHINGLPAELDLYGGLTFGIAIYHSSTSYSYNGNLKDGHEFPDVDPVTNANAKLWAQVGGRYFFSPNWAAQLEFTSSTNAILGLSYRF